MCTHQLAPFRYALLCNVFDRDLHGGHRQKKTGPIEIHTGSFKVKDKYNDKNTNADLRGDCPSFVHPRTRCRNLHFPAQHPECTSSPDRLCPSLWTGTRSFNDDRGRVQGSTASDGRTDRRDRTVLEGSLGRHVQSARTADMRRGHDLLGEQHRRRSTRRAGRVRRPSPRQPEDADRIGLIPDGEFNEVKVHLVKNTICSCLTAGPTRLLGGQTHARVRTQIFIYLFI